MSTTMTIEEAKQFLKDNWHEGCECPACGQFVKRYPRKLTASMAVGLISLYSQTKHTTAPLHIKKIAHVNGGEFAQLKRWGLIKDADNTETYKRKSGWWWITNKGVSFVKSEIQVPMYCDTYNGKTLGFSDEMTTIQQALGNKFDYQELIGGVKLDMPKAVSWLKDE